MRHSTPITNHKDKLGLGKEPFQVDGIVQQKRVFVAGHHKRECGIIRTAAACSQRASSLLDVAHDDVEDKVAQHPILQVLVDAGHLHSSLLVDVAHCAVHGEQLRENVRLRAAGHLRVRVKEDAHEGGATAGTAADEDNGNIALLSSIQHRGFLLFNRRQRSVPGGGVDEHQVDGHKEQHPLQCAELGDHFEAV